MHRDDSTWQALQRLAEDGSDLTRPMSMDFFVAVPNKAAGRAVADRAQALGFEATVEQDQESREWTCYCTATLVPSYEAVVRIEDLLDGIAQDVGGKADGFGSYGNADQT